MLSDDSGDIKLVGFNEHAETIHKSLQNGQTYLLSMAGELTTYFFSLLLNFWFFIFIVVFIFIFIYFTCQQGFVTGSGFFSPRPGSGFSNFSGSGSVFSTRIRTVKKIKNNFLLKITIIYVYRIFSRQRGLDPGSGFGQEKIMDPDPVCPERLDPDPVKIRTDSKPWPRRNKIQRTHIHVCSSS